MDATPLRLGQEFGGFARQLQLSIERARTGLAAVLELPVGGTAVGSGHQYASGVWSPRGCKCWPRDDRHPVRRSRQSLRSQRPTRWPGRMPRPTADDRHDAVQCRQQHSLARLRSALRFYEVQFPIAAAGQFDHAGQGESGDVRKHDAGCRAGDGQRPDDRGQRCSRRPVPAEHHDAGDGPYDAGKHPPAGHARPGLCRVLRCRTWKPTKKRARRLWSRACRWSPASIRYIGYEKAAKLAKEAFKTGKTIRELCREQNILPEETLKEALDPMSMTEPHAD